MNMANPYEAYYSDGRTAAQAVPSARVTFIQKTYLHLAGAILAFIGLETLLLRVADSEAVLRSIFGTGKMGMFLLMIGFIGAGYLARWWAHSSTSRAMQYAGLSLYVVAEVIIFLPLLYLADTYFKDQHVIAKSGLLTLGLFFGLTTAVFVTKADFSWMGSALCVLGWVALLTIVAGMIFGFSLGLWFSAAMILLASGYIVYDTSNILHHYPTESYVGAALELFASVALLFYYILRFTLQQSGNRD
jgi:FtsH-binding integral membrane protein